MDYISTRDATVRASFEDALFSGYAPGGGLYVPRSLPQLSNADLKSFSSLTFPQLAHAILSRFISPKEVPEDNLRDICEKSFHDGFDQDCVVPVVQIGSKCNSPTFVAELFHGPTMCFKDLGMQGVIQLLAYFSAKRKRKACLLAATTGDTGPAAVQAVRQCDSPYLSCIIHYPKGQISEFQRRQMTTADSPMVTIVEVEGGGDDMDRPIKELLTEQHSSTAEEGDSDDRVLLCGVNSYNIGRPLMQMAHFFWAYLRVCEQLQTEPGELTLDIVVPAGALGNTTAAYMSKKMGLPLGKLCVGTNVNDITHRAIQSGKFHRSDEMKQTLSEAINIQVPYNFERVLYFLTDGDDALIRKWMAEMDATAQLDLEKRWLDQLQDQFESARITDDEMCLATRCAKETLNYIIDPHTAVAFAAADKFGYDAYAMGKSSIRDTAVAIIATASACKFEEAVTTALGVDGWNDYRGSVIFPKRANAYMAKTEKPPVEYKRRDGQTLDEAQDQWKQRTLSLVRQ